MKKYHIHIYKVIEKAEVEIEAKNEIEARHKGIELATEGKMEFGKTDCKMISMEWEIK